jgi:serine protease AprX
MIMKYNVKSKLWFPALIMVGTFAAVALSVPPLRATDHTSLSATFEQPLPLDKVKTLLAAQAPADSGLIWVFFTDKAVKSEQEFKAAASKVVLTERCLKRRAKVNRQNITRADLPVAQRYVENIIQLGATLRRTSRWLNAASFQAPLAILDEIESLPFVSEIRPVARYVREPVATRAEPLQERMGQTKATALDYGNSFTQLQQIGVPTAHEDGYTGNGVVIAILDSGFRKDHEAFSRAFAEGRVLDEWDFVFDDGNTQNEAEDAVNQHNHGTFVWSALGGISPGELYGPAYEADFLLYKTEDLRSETQVEEDNWVAAVERADSVGVDIITSSLGYIDWYTVQDFDGMTAVTTRAANHADSLGIVVTTSLGNFGPGTTTLTAPADAFDVISVGAVTFTGSIAAFSSRGPTYDGRIKPEVCAMGQDTRCANALSTNSYSYVSGTSLSNPLAAGAAALVLEAHPDWPPKLIRFALMLTASQADNPDNTYGWGIINVPEAISWSPAIFTADNQYGQVPLTVSFADNSVVETSSWDWDFGDGSGSTLQNPAHVYADVGSYDVSFSVQSDLGPFSRQEPNYIIVLADTVTIEADTVYAGSEAEVNIGLTNTQSIGQIIVPVSYGSGMSVTYVDYTAAGTRTEGIGEVSVSSFSELSKTVSYTIRFQPAPLPAGSGSILKIHFSTDPFAIGGLTTTIDTVTTAGLSLLADSPLLRYVPLVRNGGIVIRDVRRGDADNDGKLTINDAVYLIYHLYRGGPAPVTIESGDANADFSISLADATLLINYIFKGGPAPIET